MSSLSNEVLIETYIKAKKLKLPADFIALINQELKSRGLTSYPGVKNKVNVSAL